MPEHDLGITDRLLAIMARRILALNNVEEVCLVRNEGVGTYFVCSVERLLAGATLLAWTDPPRSPFDAQLLEKPVETSLRMLDIPQGYPDSTIHEQWMQETGLTDLPEWQAIGVLCVGRNWREFSQALQDMRIGNDQSNPLVFQEPHLWTLLKQEAQLYDPAAHAFWPVAAAS